MSKSDPKSPGCCPPLRRTRGTTAEEAIFPSRTAEPPPSVIVPGGMALIGTAHQIIPDDAEGPIRKKRLAPFRIGTTAVTNAQFAAFIAETGYVTEAERFGWSFVFWSQVPAAAAATQGVRDVEWWRRVDGATWRHIHGPGGIPAEDLPDHPVVHVSWNDARAYAMWIGGRLPSEAEWEHAARGGLGDVRFPWGDREPDDVTHFPCNIWQGRFPQTNSCADGYETTAPAHAFAPNGYGLYNLVGNVWEWTSEPFRIRSQRRAAKARQAQMTGYKLAKGGSFLCHKSYCYRYRIAARTGNSPDSTTTHTGFRVVWAA
ncbi:formylglycine-generating enzyme family protein [Gymnodinialimonas sp. 2305UL16-5]|uniref:formylglycine-generating enzyme family protein n=1 Tax=Gymnodinialimonas mytili TaxID=3126503 RepID=UPI0030B4653F